MNELKDKDSFFFRKNDKYNFTNIAQRECGFQEHAMNRKQNIKQIPF